MKRRRPQSSFDWKRILLVAIVLAIAGYRYYQEQQAAQRGGDRPVAEVLDQDDPHADILTQTPNPPPSVSRTNRGLATNKTPDSAWPQNGTTENRDSHRSASKSSRQIDDGRDSQSAGYLRSIGERNFESPEGLIYGMAGGEHRVEHVMHHAVDDPNRPSHGVFHGDEVTILKLIDEAYAMVKDRSKYVKSTRSQGNDEYTISMGRVIGYDGGQKGQRNGHRSLKSLRLILDGKRIITAYPYR